ncbi:MAG: FKBP-type peptidyl-prolyl cis-trans isomerase [Bacteroidales bacterium]|nr:FKBP-type peptidyl-prolyl cis-trans isomerase [Bacteroidales bacterium]
MKQRIQMATFVALATLTVASCGPKSDLPGYKKTESGLHYKFLTENKKAQQVQMDDVLDCELVLVFENDTLYSNTNNSQLLLQATDRQFEGSLEEGLVMMHKGDVASFAINADSLAVYHTMPAKYEAGKGQKMYYTIKLNNIVSADSIAAAEQMFLSDMQELQHKEPQLLAQYIADNNIQAEPNANGLYVIVNKKGAGANIAMGSTVAFNYTGRLLDGTVFDSNVESVAKEAGIYETQRNYQPEEFVMGQASYVRGLLEGLYGLQKGTKATLIIPSHLGYGAKGRGEKIRPYSTLIFDIEIVNVK